MEIIQVCEICQNTWLILPTKKQMKLLKKYEADMLLQSIYCELCEKEKKK